MKKKIIVRGSRKSYGDKRPRTDLTSDEIKAGLQAKKMSMKELGIRIGGLSASAVSSKLSGWRGHYFDVGEGEKIKAVLGIEHEPGRQTAAAEPERWPKPFGRLRSAEDPRIDRARLKAEMKRQGITQSEICELIGLRSHSVRQRLFDGETNFTPKEAEGLVDLLGGAILADRDESAPTAERLDPIGQEDEKPEPVASEPMPVAVAEKRAVPDAVWMRMTQNMFPFYTMPDPGAGQRRAVLIAYGADEAAIEDAIDQLEMLDARIPGWLTGRELVRIRRLFNAAGRTDEQRSENMAFYKEIVERFKEGFKEMGK